MRTFLVKLVNGKIEASIPVDGGEPLLLGICARCEEIGDCRAVAGVLVCAGCATPQEIAAYCAEHCIVQGPLN